VTIFLSYTPFSSVFSASAYQGKELRPPGLEERRKKKKRRGKKGFAGPFLL